MLNWSQERFEPAGSDFTALDRTVNGPGAESVLAGEDNFPLNSKGIDQTPITRSESRVTTSRPFLPTPVECHGISSKIDARDRIGNTVSPAV
jgi:hypothetical protein